VEAARAEPGLPPCPADDTFWAARRVMAFTDDMIRAAVATGDTPIRRPRSTSPTR
jgi:hypothetical protein